MIWSMPTVWSVARLYAEADLDNALDARDPRAREAVAEKMFRRIRQMAETFAAVPDMGDMVVAERPGHAFTTTFRMRWWPASREVELSGGHRDGEVLTLGWEPGRFAVAPLFLPRQMSRPALADDAGPTATEHEEWQAVGFNERSRRWVFEQKG